MRISGGRARGVTLAVPHGDRVRPATDGLRQAVFSSLAARVPNTRFLDLFAGSGAYGLEALSRGALSGIFVEKNARAAACIELNLATVAKSLGRIAKDLARISRADVFAWSPPSENTGAAEANLIFIDPPYELITDLAPKLFERLSGWLPAASGADPLVIFETPGEIALNPTGWRPIKRIGGKTPRQPGVTVFRRI